MLSYNRTLENLVYRQTFIAKALVALMQYFLTY